ncbi:MAG: hypothetical protein RL684_2523 [Pseudomonadota bacterium]|jgi:DNA-binding XRE family transcriptional regulator
MAAMIRLAKKSPRVVCRELGLRLRAHRLQQHVQQEELARRAGVSVGTIKNLENRPWSTSLENFVCAAVGLQLHPEVAHLFKTMPRCLANMLRPGRAPRVRARPRKHANKLPPPRASAATRDGLAAGFGPAEE